MSVSVPFHWNCLPILHWDQEGCIPPFVQHLQGSCADIRTHPGTLNLVPALL